MSTFTEAQAARIEAAGLKLAAAETLHQDEIRKWELFDCERQYNITRMNTIHEIESTIKRVARADAWIWGGTLESLDLEGAGSCYASSASFYLTVKDTREADGDLLLSLKITSMGSLSWPSALMVSDRDTIGMGEEWDCLERKSVSDRSTNEERISAAFMRAGHPAPEEAAREAAIYIEAAAQILAEAEAEMEGLDEAVYSTEETCLKIEALSAKEIADRNTIAELSKLYS